MNRRPRLFTWGLPLLSALLLAYAVSVVLGGRPADARTETTSTPPSPPRDAPEVVAGAGLVEPSSQLVGVGSQVPGVVAAVHVRVDDEVRSGEPLFTLDDRDQTAALAAREAALVSAERTLATAAVERREREAQLALYERIADPRAIVQEELTRRRFAAEAAAARLSAAEAAVTLARAEVAQARVGRDLRVVRAPIGGRVLQLNVRPGEFAAAAALSTPLVVIGQTRPLHVRIDVDEADIARLAPGEAAWVSPRGAPQRHDRVSFVRIEPLVVPKRSLTNAVAERVDTRVLQVIYALPDGASGFFVGQQVDAFLPAAPAGGR